MLRQTILIFAFSSVLISNSFAQNFKELTSKMFFGIDLSKPTSNILSDFKAIAELTLKEDTGWSMYPPMDEKGSFIPFYTYSFSRHPYFISNVNKGGLMVLIRNDTLMGLSLSLSFDSKHSFDSTYNNLRKLYAKSSSKIIKRPNIAPPFEVTKFVSNRNSDFIIVTKGEDDNQPYLVISYNYQGFEW